MATWTTTTVNATYPKVLSIAQSKNTGQYMLSLVTNAADTTDARGRVFKSNDYGSTWTLLEDLFPINGTDTSHLNYATLSAGSYGSWVFYSCAMGTSVRTSPTIENGTLPAGVIQMMYSPGPYPVYFSDYVFFQSFTHFSGLTPATGSITEFGGPLGNYFTSTVPALYDNDFTTISRRVVYHISSGNLYKNTTGTGSGVLINPSGWPVSNAEGGGVAVSTLGTIVVATRFVSPNGGLWLSNDGGTNWTQKLVNVNLNAVDMSSDGKYIIAGPRDPTTGVGRFYLSQDFGATWTNQDLSFTGILHKLHITNNGKRAVGAGMKSGYGYFQPTTTGYITYTAPMTAAEQRDSGKTVAQLLALSYSVNDIRNAGYSPNQLLAGGIVPNWNYYTANKIGQTYVNNFIDLSGDMIIRNASSLIVGGDVSFNNMTVIGSTKFANDTTLKSRLFIGSDISCNGNLYVGGDLSVNGQFSGNFANNVIPTSAIINYPSIGSSNAVITGNVRIAGDASFNGTTVDLSTNTILQLSGQVAFTDGTTMSTYDDNILSGSFALGTTVFKDSTFAAVTCTGVATTTTKITSSDYRLKTNVIDLDESYSVDELAPIQYDNILSNIHELGLIAHELQAVYPELVKGDKDGEEYQRVNYNGLIGVLVKEVQELKRRKENLCKK